MRRQVIFKFICFATILAVFNLGQAGAKNISHPFVCADINARQAMKVNAAGKVTWSYPAKLLHDIWSLPNGNVLIAGPVTGVQEISHDKKVVWQYKAPRGYGVYGCQPLPGGVTMVILQGKPNRIVEVSRNGKINKSVDLVNRGPVRLARKTKSGTYLVAARSEKSIHEYDATGKLIRKIKAPGNVYMAVRLDNGNTLIACGDGHTIVEINKQDKTVWQIKENELPDNPLRFIAGVQRLPNGNTVICNWGGHGHIGKQPQIIEVTRDKKIVWQIFDNKQFKTPVHVQLLDIAGDPLKGELLR